MKKRIFSLLLAVVLLLNAVPMAFAAAFSDVPGDTWYSAAVDWAVEQGITTGTGNGMFSPDATCTRGQVVTFLWRSQGQPAPTSNSNPFVDVQPGAFYYDAVLWAVENNITTGTGANTFSPDASCTRGQVVTFLWRSQGQPAPMSSNNPFADVRSDAYYYNAVLWAVENGITTGTGADTFSPDNMCTRAHVVTFLWRSQGQPGLTVWYSDSMYRVGIDIPAGDYYAVATSDVGGYYCKYDDKYMEDIEDNDNFDTWTYFRAYEGQYLKLNRCKITPIENAPTNLQPTNGYYGVGTYRIGVDIPAGEYRFVATGNISGYYCAYSDITYTDIDDNDNFDSVAFYTVTNGQYLTVKRASFELIEAAAPQEPDTPDYGEEDTEEDDGKYSYSEAKELNEHASKATKNTNDAMGLINKSYSGMAALRATYINQAISCIQGSMMYLDFGLAILEDHVPLEYTSGDHATVTDVVRESYDLLDTVDDLVADTSNYEDIRDLVLDALMTAGTLNLKFQKATVDLLSAFS